MSNTTNTNQAPVQTSAEPTAVGRISIENYATDVQTQGHTIRVDQPTDIEDGLNTGPTPFGYLYAALAGCMLMTVRGYAARKQWPLKSSEVRIFPTRDKSKVLESIRIELDLEGDDLTEEQITRLREIALKCPVHRSLEKAIEVELA
ncbi:MAG: OsmC family protein [Phycisphaerales bacterium JB065]